MIIMKKIKLVNTENKFTLVDNEIFEKLGNLKWKWRLHSAGYAMRNTEKRGIFIYLHREIMNAKKGELVDHINFNKLDNRQENLRLCSSADNSRHKIQKRGKSNYMGVSY